MLLSAIWTDPDAAEWLFLVAAIAFAIEALLALTRPTSAVKYLGFFIAVGAVLVALGLLAA